MDIIELTPEEFKEKMDGTQKQLSELFEESQSNQTKILEMFGGIKYE